MCCREGSGTLKVKVRLLWDTRVDPAPHRCTRALQSVVSVGAAYPVSG
jgi:hypothetical protein